jgi:hypothetical protein
MEDMIVLIVVVDQFSKISGTHLIVNKCKIAAFINDLQVTPRKSDRDKALRARLAYVNLMGCPIGSLTKD